MQYTFWSCLIRCTNMKWIQPELWALQSGHGMRDVRGTDAGGMDGQTDRRSETNLPPNNFVVWGYNEKNFTKHASNTKWTTFQPKIHTHWKPLQGSSALSNSRVCSWVSEEVHGWVNKWMKDEWRGDRMCYRVSGQRNDWVSGGVSGRVIEWGSDWVCH